MNEEKEKTKRKGFGQEDIHLQQEMDVKSQTLEKENN